MVAPYYVMPGGKFPFQNGHPVLITQEQFEECCCDEAPCECPAGVDAEYNVTMTWEYREWDGSTCGDGNIINSGSETLTMKVIVDDTPCLWIAEDDQADIPFIRLGLSTVAPCRWVARGGINAVAFAGKDTGDTPVGAYDSDGWGCAFGMTGWLEERIINVSVSEVAP